MLFQIFTTTGFVQLGAGSDKLVKQIADLTGIDPAALSKRLTTRRLTVGAQQENYEKKFSPEEALINRDSIAKSVYNAIFNWVVKTINKVLYSGEDENINWIGVLDIFGFECFQNNSFEQVPFFFVLVRL